MSLVSKVNYIYVISLEFIRKITIPTSKQEKYNKTYAAINQIVCPIAMITLLGGNYQ